MPVYIKDSEVDRLATGLTGLTKTSEVDAVKDALKDAIASPKGKLPIRECSQDPCNGWGRWSVSSRRRD